MSKNKQAQTKSSYLNYLNFFPWNVIQRDLCWSLEATGHRQQVMQLTKFYKLLFIFIFFGIVNHLALENLLVQSNIILYFNFSFCPVYFFLLWLLRDGFSFPVGGLDCPWQKQGAEWVFQAQASLLVNNWWMSSVKVVIKRRYNMGSGTFDLSTLIIVISVKVQYIFIFQDSLNPLGSLIQTLLQIFPPNWTS